MNFFTYKIIVAEIICFWENLVFYVLGELKILGSCVNTRCELTIIDNCQATIYPIEIVYFQKLKPSR